MAQPVYRAMRDCIPKNIEMRWPVVMLLKHVPLYGTTIVNFHTSHVGLCLTRTELSKNPAVATR